MKRIPCELCCKSCGEYFETEAGDDDLIGVHAICPHCLVEGEHLITEIDEEFCGGEA